MSSQEFIAKGIAAITLVFALIVLAGIVFDWIAKRIEDRE